MRQIVITAVPVPKDQIFNKLEEHHICINRYAEVFFSHPRFCADHSERVTVSIASLREIGFDNGATLADIFQRLPEVGLKPCCPETGLFLRLAWTDQPKSGNTILSGTHEVPDQAVTVLSEIVEQDDAFPKGLYLRNVDGVLWLRGYLCDPEYRFPSDAMFAFETIR